MDNDWSDVLKNYAHINTTECKLCGSSTKLVEVWQEAKNISVFWYECPNCFILATKLINNPNQYIN